MASSKMAAALLRLRRAEISFDALVAQTQSEWRKIAEYVHRRWPLPPSVSVEDVEQELLVGAWEATGRWDPNHENAAGLQSFVIWSAISRAQKWIHKQRGAGKHYGRAPSRFELPISFFSEERETSLVVAEEAAQDRTCLADEILSEALATCDNDLAVAAVFALAACRGDVEAAAARLLSDPWARRVGASNLERATRACLLQASKIADIASAA